MHGTHFALVGEEGREDDPRLGFELLECVIIGDLEDNGKVSTIDWKTFILSNFSLLFKLSLNIFKSENL
jgi:hypothetical protein